MRRNHFLLSILIVTSSITLTAQNLHRYTASLPATDGLGRRLPTWEEVGDERPDRFVGLFYWTWHTNFADLTSPFDVTKFLAAHPDAIDDYDAPAWGGDHPTHFWGEPLFGYYRDTDPWVLRKHAEMLGEAGVDVIIFDCTNGNYSWRESYMALCEVFEQARRDGVKTPQIAFILAFGPTEGSHDIIREIYADLYQPGRYQDLWFYWKGKPLIMAYPEMLRADDATDCAIRDFFTFRPGQPLYQGGATRPDHWGWLETYPQTRYVPLPDGRCEEVTVGVAQNWSEERGLTAMNAPGSFGRSYTDRTHTSPDSTAWGLNFQEQWDRALSLDPEFIFITGWNEWIAGRYRLWQQQPNAFPDEFSQEKSRDIEPMRGGHGDAYYWQMVANIRRYKGMPRPSRYDAGATHRGNTLVRDSQGWLGTHYTNRTGRNDLVGATATEEGGNLLFTVNCAEALQGSAASPYWMTLYIDCDCNHATGWEGYDYCVVHDTRHGDALQRYDGTTWHTVATVATAVHADGLTVTIPRRAIGLTKGQPVHLEYKWTDNVAPGDILRFWTAGDVAPMGRFNYIYTTPTDEWQLVWSDEFNVDGPLNAADWGYEHGFVRNHEDQWYQPANAVCRDGCLCIEARHDSVPNPRYRPDGRDWRSQRPYAAYTSASVNTRGHHQWLYGRFEVRAKIPTGSGSWPAIWTLGVSRPWPVNGEIDIMEYYRIHGVPHILANVAWGSDDHRAIWSTGATPYAHFTDRDPEWADKFHTWRMDWDEEYIRLYLDDELLNEVPTTATSCARPTDVGRLGAAGHYSPNLYDAFHQPHYLLLNLAIGGDNGGRPDPADYPLLYQIDYVRIYQRP